MAMNTLRINAYAKLNLTLDITGSDGGYHMLDSVVTTVDLFDRVVLKKRRDGLVGVTMHGMGSETIPPEANNAVRAAEAFVAAFGTAGVDITVWKNIPMAAGLGGSSADSAAVIAGMGRLFDVKDPKKLQQLAAACGSDTAYLLRGGMARITRRGECVAPLPFVKMYFLVVVPERGVSTAEAYRTYDLGPQRRGVRSGAVQEALARGDVASAARWFGNDLYSAARAICAEAEEAYLAARSFSPLGAGMTGSGSAAFACFETRELAEWARSRFRGKHRCFVAESVEPKQIKMSHSPFALGEGEGEEDISWKKD